MGWEDRIVSSREYRVMVEKAEHPIITASLQNDIHEVVEALRDDIRYATMAVDKNGHCPLALAAKNGCEDAAREIISYRADVGAKCYLRVSPLHYAAQSGHVEVARRLLTSRAEVNCTDDALGHTPLHDAAKIGRCAVAELLLQARADTSQKDSRAHTARDLALLGGHLSVANLLKNHI